MSKIFRMALRAVFRAGIGAFFGLKKIPLNCLPDHAVGGGGLEGGQVPLPRRAAQEAGEDVQAEREPQPVAGAAELRDSVWAEVRGGSDGGRQGLQDGAAGEAVAVRRAGHHHRQEEAEGDQHDGVPHRPHRARRNGGQASE